MRKTTTTCTLGHPPSATTTIKCDHSAASVQITASDQGDRKRLKTVVGARADLCCHPPKGAPHVLPDHDPDDQGLGLSGTISGRHHIARRCPAPGYVSPMASLRLHAFARTQPRRGYCQGRGRRGFSTQSSTRWQRRDPHEHVESGFPGYDRSFGAVRNCHHSTGAILKGTVYATGSWFWTRTKHAGLSITICRSLFDNGRRHARLRLLSTSFCRATDRDQWRRRNLFHNNKQILSVGSTHSRVTTSHRLGGRGDHYERS